MRWGSFDPFLTEDAFWQDRMGMPVANKEFLRALLQNGSFDSYHFFCDDTVRIEEFKGMLDRVVTGSARDRARASLQGFFMEDFARQPIDVMHHGDFTTFFPHLIELRNGNSLLSTLPISGVTHALDTVKLHTSFLQILLANPRPFDTIICTSRCAVEMLTRAFEHIRHLFDKCHGAKLPAPPSLVQIPLGIQEELFVPQDRARCRIELGIPTDQLVMLSLGRFSPRRKTDLSPFLECIAWLKGRRREGAPSLPPFKLILAGAGRTADIKLVYDIVNRLGLQPEVQIEENVSLARKLLLYGAADFFISLVDNYQETFGLSIIEAMAQSLPVIASDFNGYRELVAQDRTGFLIPTHASMEQEPWESLSGLLNYSMLRFYRAQKVGFDFMELAKAVLVLSTRPELRLEMGRRARIRAAPYRWASVIPLYEETWVRKKEEAVNWAASGETIRTTPPMLTPPTLKYFSHYPSRCMTSGTRIILSGYGFERCREDFQPIIYEEMSVLLNQECLNLMLECLSKRTWSIEELVGECRSRLAISAQVLLIHLDWLMKHGYLGLSEDEKSVML